MACFSSLAQMVHVDSDQLQRSKQITPLNVEGAYSSVSPDSVKTIGYDRARAHHKGNRPAMSSSESLLRIRVW